VLQQQRLRDEHRRAVRAAEAVVIEGEDEPVAAPDLDRSGAGMVELLHAVEQAELIEDVQPAGLDQFTAELTVKRVVLFEDGDAVARAGESAGEGETGWPRADNDDVRFDGNYAPVAYARYDVSFLDRQREFLVGSKAAAGVTRP
jgi:hypothetical protein